MSTAWEEALVFEVAGDQLVGVLHRPAEPVMDAALLLVVGGPQYRVGSHRQFVLLARALAAAGIPALRFDYRGMGDSTGAQRGFESLNEDIRAAINTLESTLPGIRGVYLWGLCDAATANVFHAVRNNRVLGQVALNPWVRTAEGEARAFLKHYYLRRIVSRDFWRKIVGLQWNLRQSLRDLLRKLRLSRGATRSPASSLPERVRRDWLDFEGPSLLILSGKDLTAKEFEDTVAQDAQWSAWMTSAQVTVKRLAEADHTFSKAAWRDQVAQWTIAWLLDRKRGAS